MSPRTDLPIRPRRVGFAAVTLPTAVGLVGLPPRTSVLLLVTIRLASAPLVPPRRRPRSRSRRRGTECPRRPQSGGSSRPGCRFPVLACCGFSISCSTSHVSLELLGEILDDNLLVASLENIAILVGDSSHVRQIKPRRGRVPAITSWRSRDPCAGFRGSASTSSLADGTTPKRRVLPPVRPFRGLGCPAVRTDRAPDFS